MNVPLLTFSIICLGLYEPIVITVSQSSVSLKGLIYKERVSGNPSIFIKTTLSVSHPDGRHLCTPSDNIIQWVIP